MSSLTVSLVQTPLVWEQPQANLELFSQLLLQLPKHTQLVVLPEMFTTGFSMQTNLAETEDGPALQWMHQQAQRLQIPVCGSIMFKENRRYYNRFVWMNPNGTNHMYNKRHLFSMGNEHLHYTPGTARMLIEYNGWNLFPIICYDLRFPIWLRRTHQFNYDAMLVVANWPDKRIQHWQTLLQARAIENQTYVLACNRIGTDASNTQHSGYSGSIDMQGNWMSKEVNTQTIITTTLQKEPLQQWRTTFPALDDADTFRVE